MKHDVRRTFGQHWAGAIAAYTVMDVLFAGLGMGTPAFTPLLGFAVGWFAARRAEFFKPDVRGAMLRSLRYALVTSGITVVIMALVWARLVPYLFERRVDPGNMGLPLDLYSTRASLGGWLLLMVGVGPAAQFLLTAFGSYLTFLVRFKRLPGPVVLPPEA